MKKKITNKHDDLLGDDSSSDLVSDTESMKNKKLLEEKLKKEENKDGKTPEQIFAEGVAATEITES